MLFIDEVDALGSKRGNGLVQNKEQEQTLNQLLNEMDGFMENDQIIVVAATNLVESIDPALQRPGRFDRKIEIKLPNAIERFKILQIHMRDKPNNLRALNLSEAAKDLEGYSGADIE